MARKRVQKSPATPKPEPIDVPKAQEIIFQPNPGPQTDFLSASEQEVLFGGSAGGGKSFAMLADPVRSFSTPGFRGLLLRRTTEELRELISVSKQLYPRAIKGAKFLERDKTWVLPSGATLWMSYLDADDDVLRYQGQAFQWIGFDELTQWPSPHAWDYLRSRLRGSTATGLDLYQRATSNPGGPGHCVPFGEVLTTSGWKDIKTVKAGDKVFSVDRQGFLTVKPVSDRVEIEFDGVMVNKKDQMIFTDNHRLPMKTPNGLDVRPFNDLPGQCNIYRAAEIAPLKEASGYFIVPEYKTRATRLEQPDRITQEQYSELLGWFLSEGHTNDRDKEFGISQLKEPQRTEIKNLLDSCGFKYRIHSSGFSISSPKWWNYFKQFGKSRNKFIPRDFYKQGCPVRLFNSLMSGDGHWYSGSSGVYYTTSKQLADDFSELCVRMGLSCYIKSRQRKNRNGLSYEVNFGSRKTTELVTGNHIYKVKTKNKSVNVSKYHFTGTVYCITVPETETFFIRQNGYIWLSGNTWVKKTFIDPESPGKAFYATDIETGRVLTYPSTHKKSGQPLFKRRFIPSKLKDNPYLNDDGMYEANLLSLPEHKRKQLLEGNWDVNEGSAFPEFNRDVHVIEPYEIPNYWTKFRACDYGYGSHTGVLWIAVNPTGQLVVYRELYVTKVTAEALADMILEIEEDERISYGVLDSSLWHKRGDRGPSLAEQMLARGCRWRPSDRSRGSRVSGKNEIHRRLKIDDFTEEPGLVFFENCRHTISQIPSLPIDKNNPEDVDTRSEDHLYDALRYGVMTRPRSSDFSFDSNMGSVEQKVFDPVFGY